MITKTELFDVTYDRVFRGPPDLPPLVGTLAALPTHVQQCIIAYGEAVRAQARAEMRAEKDAAFNRAMFVAAGIVVTAYDQPTIAGEIIQAAGPDAVKDVDEYDAGVLAPHFPQFAPYAPYAPKE